MKWFGSYEPDSLLLWDPGAADATLHALQAAVPHKRVIPVNAQRIEIDRTATAPVCIRAVEKAALAETYIFDIEATDAAGKIVYRWIQVAFRAVGPIEMPSVLATAPMLSRPYLERAAREALGDDTIEVAVVHEDGGSRVSRRAALLQRLTVGGMIEHRGDGRQLRTDQRGSISLAHDDVISLAMTAEAQISCDIEAVRARDAKGLDELRLHIAFEVCRKLGHMPGTTIRAPAPGTITFIGEIVLGIVDLPMPSGNHAVGFGCIRRSDINLLRKFTFPITEAVS
jgi:enediyne polyketide synthase